MAHVLIVGAGPAGASLAHLLVRRGVEVTLLERQRDFHRAFRGEILMPSGLDALEQMGLAPALAGVRRAAQHAVAVYLNRRLLFEAEFGAETAGARPLEAVSQPGLLEAIVAEAGKSPHFRLERGASVKDLLLGEGRVTGVRVQTDAGEQHLHADLVVGCDGRASLVRKKGGLAAHRVDQPMDVVWCKLPCPDEWRGVRVYAGRGHLLIGYPTWDGSLQLAWIILKGTFGELRSRGVPEWIEEMARQVSADFAEQLRAQGEAIQKPFLLDAVCDRVESWSAPGLLVIGDAAHTMSPVGGQGINIALRDSIVAANQLVPVLSRARAEPARLDAALRRIEEERLPEVARIQARQAGPPRILLSRNWWGEPVRRALGALLRRPRVRALAQRGASDFLTGARPVQLRV